jgi:hypothetical protein
MTFKVTLHFCNYTSFVTKMSYDSGLTWFRPIEQDATQIYTTTKRTLGFTLKSNQVDPDCGYKIGNWTTTVTEQYGTSSLATSYFNSTSVTGTYVA